MPLMKAYAAALVRRPRAFALAVSALTVLASSFSIFTSPEGYVNLTDPTAGFTSRKTEIMGKILAMEKVDEPYVYDMDWPFYGSIEEVIRFNRQKSRSEHLISRDQGRRISAFDGESNSAITSVNAVNATHEKSVNEKQKRGSRDLNWLSNKGFNATEPLCPSLLKSGDEPIILLFATIKNQKTEGAGSLISREALEGMCLLDKKIRKFVDGRGMKLSDICKKDSGGNCCATRTIGTLKFAWSADIDGRTAGSAEHRGSDERSLRVPSKDCHFTDADASAVMETLRNCAPHFSQDGGRFLMECAAAEERYSRIKSSWPMWTFKKVLECNAKVPRMCLWGTGAGVLDAFLSLLPSETAKNLADKNSGVDLITQARIMVPVTGHQSDHANFKVDLMSMLQQHYYYANGKKNWSGSGESGVALVAYHLGIKRHLLEDLILADIYYAILACVCVSIRLIPWP